MCFFVHILYHAPFFIDIYFVCYFYLKIMQFRLHLTEILTISSLFTGGIYFFTQASMDLPPDKAKLLKSYDDDKKWELICDQVCILFFLPKAASCY